MSECWGCNSTENWDTIECEISFCMSTSDDCRWAAAWLSYRIVDRTVSNTTMYPNLQWAMDAAYDRYVNVCSNSSFTGFPGDGTHTNDCQACVGAGAKASADWYVATCGTDDDAICDTYFAS